MKGHSAFVMNAIELAADLLKNRDDQDYKAGVVDLMAQIALPEVIANNGEDLATAMIEAAIAGMG